MTVTRVPTTPVIWMLMTRTVAPTTTMISLGTMATTGTDRGVGMTTLAIRRTPTTARTVRTRTTQRT